VKNSVYVNLMLVSNNVQNIKPVNYELISLSQLKHDNLCVKKPTSFADICDVTAVNATWCLEMFSMVSNFVGCRFKLYLKLPLQN